MFTHTSNDAKPDPERYPAWPFGFGVKPSLIGSRLVGGLADNQHRKDRDGRVGSVAGIRCCCPGSITSRASPTTRAPSISGCDPRRVIRSRFFFADTSPDRCLALQLA